jgi:membrane peptidoglycan carboxypeptidase
LQFKKPMIQLTPYPISAEALLSGAGACWLVASKVPSAASAMKKAHQGGSRKGLKMKKNFRAFTASWVMVLLAICVGTSLTAQAKSKRSAASKKQTASKSKKAATSQTASKKASGKNARGTSSKAAKTLAESKSARRGKFGKSVTEDMADNSRSSRSKRSSRNQSSANDKQVQALLKKRGKLTKAEQRQLSSIKSSRRRRARALQLARLRAIRARDEALRNSAASNIEKDNHAGEDLEIRQAAISALQGRSGTVVVMDPSNGRIFTIVNQQMALGSPVKPCSTTKLIVGLAALHEGVFDPNQDVQFARSASMNLTDAIARSNNPVFQVLGRMLGYDRVMKYADNFGFGQKTGVNYPGESDGFLPEEGEQETGHMSSHGDGFGVTAIQLAAFTGAIANGGNLYTPRVPRTAEAAESFTGELKRRIQMTPEDRTRMMSGMIGAVNYGTAKLAYNQLGQVAGKTGTCTGNRDKLGLFTSFSSVDNPRVVVTVITTGSTEAGKRAAEIAGRIYSSIAPRFFRDRMLTPASAGIEISTLPSSNPSQASSKAIMAPASADIETPIPVRQPLGKGVGKVSGKVLTPQTSSPSPVPPASATGIETPAAAPAPTRQPSGKVGGKVMSNLQN